MFPDLQDHLGQVQGKVQHQRQPGVGQEQGQPKGLISGQNRKDKSFWGRKTGLISDVYGLPLPLIASFGHTGVNGDLETLAKRAARSAASTY